MRNPLMPPPIRMPSMKDSPIHDLKIASSPSVREGGTMESNVNEIREHFSALKRIAREYAPHHSADIEALERLTVSHAEGSVSDRVYLDKLRHYSMMHGLNPYHLAIHEAGAAMRERMHIPHVSIPNFGKTMTVALPKVMMPKVRLPVFKDRRLQGSPFGIPIRRRPDMPPTVRRMKPWPRSRNPFLPIARLPKMISPPQRVRNPFLPAVRFPTHQGPQRRVRMMPPPIHFPKVSLPVFHDRRRRRI